MKRDSTISSSNRSIGFLNIEIDVVVFIPQLSSRRCARFIFFRHFEMKPWHCSDLTFLSPVFQHWSWTCHLFLLFVIRLQTSLRVSDYQNKQTKKFAKTQSLIQFQISLLLVNFPVANLQNSLFSLSGLCRFIIALNHTLIISPCRYRIIHPIKINSVGMRIYFAACEIGEMWKLTRE